MQTENTIAAQKIGSKASRHADAFLKLLGKTPEQTHYRTFDDSKQGGPMLARKFSGPLHQVAAALRALNDEGAGVFVVVNDGGQTKESITRVLAVFADTDGAPLEPIVTALPPHIVVQSSPGKWHVYWLVTEDFPLEIFGPVQSAIAVKFGTDPAVKDLPRVMRLPGLKHCKGEPVMVKVTQHNNQLPRYTAMQIVEGLGLTIGASTKTPPLFGPAPDFTKGAIGNLLAAAAPDYPPSDANLVADQCQQVRAFRETGGSSEPIWYLNIGVVKHCVDGEKCAHEWSAKFAGYDHGETKSKIDHWVVGPTTCDKFKELNPAGCQGCMHTCKSPIQLGAAVSTAMVPPSPDVCQLLNDAANADRFIRAFGAVVRYIIELRVWMVWHKQHWRIDNKGQIIELAKIAAKSIYDEAKDAANQTDRNALSRWAGSSLQLGRLEAMVKLAQAALAVSVCELDADPWSFAIKNGVINLRNGEFRAARQDDLLTKIANVEYDSKASCPTWESFVDGCAGGNKNLVDLLQRAGGYSLSGSTAEQVFFFLYGDGANGKSTLVNALREIMGGYGVQSQPEVIMSQRNSNPSGPTPEIARLAGARFCAMVETEDGQRLAESRVKQMTGGDAMTARVLQGNPFDFVPSFKLWLAGNHRPVIRGDDHGIWRRIVLIPFLVKIEKEKRDKHLPEKLRNEYPGILNWLIRGCLDWQRYGLNLPPEVTKEIEAYKSDMDLIAQWLDERVTIGPAATWGARHAYMNFSAWGKDGGHNVITEVRFAQKMDERGFTKRATRGGKVYAGLEPRQTRLI
jgi:putative DNA primase/helicase